MHSTCTHSSRCDGGGGAVPRRGSRTTCRVLTLAAAAVSLPQCMRIAFADTRWYVADPDVESVPIAELISEEYGETRRKLFNAAKVCVRASHVAAAA